MTQTGTIGFGWDQILGTLVGAGITAVIFSTYAWLRRRQKIARNERPPQQGKILRPAGYSLSCRIENLNDKLNMAATESVLAGMLLGYQIGGLYPLATGLLLNQFTFDQLRARPDAYYLWPILFLFVSSLAWLIAAITRSIQHLREMRNCRFGLRGEQDVAEKLANQQLLAAGYVTFHDVPGDGEWNIDHVTIGPSGIYVLETKTRPRRKPVFDQDDQYVLYDGKVLRFPWCYDKKAVRQVERNAAWVKHFIADFAPNDILVQPVILVPGWYATAKGAYHVQVMPPDYLVKACLLPAKRLFTPEQLRPLIRRFDERCRDLEF